MYGGTPERPSTCRRSVRSTESYAFCRSMKHMNSDTRAFLLNSCSLRTVNIIPVVERCGRNLHCSSDTISFASQQAPSLVATILRRTLPRVLRVRCRVSSRTRSCHSCADFVFTASRQRCGTFRWYHISLITRWNSWSTVGSWFSPSLRELN